MLYDTILCATDGLSHSDRALRHAARLAADTVAELHVVHVAEPTSGAALLAGEWVPTPVDRRAQVETQVRNLARRHRLAVVRHYLSADGATADRIAALADEIGADLLIVGSRGRSELAGAVIGSVSRRLSHLTQQPILIVTGDRAVRRRRRSLLQRAPVAAIG